MANELRYSWKRDLPLPPGETIRELLQERGIQQNDFAVRMGKSEKFISQLVNGKASLTHETAIELERVLGVPSSFWNGAEAQYRDVLARQNMASPSDEDIEWASSFPLKAMEANRWIARETDPAEQLGEVLNFFGVSSREAFNSYWGAERRLAARMSTAYTSETPAIAAWLRAGEIQAESVSTEPFDEPAFRALLEELRGATRLPVEEWQRMMRERSSALGVAVVFVPELPKTRCYAVSWWVAKGRAVIQLGLRGKTDDQVWFSFYHEAGHLLLDDRKQSRISDLDGDPASEERANSFASETLIPPEEYTAFLSAGRPTKASVTAFADRIGLAPSIVVGRLQRDRKVPFSHMNDLKTRLEWT